MDIQYEIYGLNPLRVLSRSYTLVQPKEVLKYPLFPYSIKKKKQSLSTDTSRRSTSLLSSLADISQYLQNNNTLLMSLIPPTFASPRSFPTSCQKWKLSSYQWYYVAHEVIVKESTTFQEYIFPSQCWFYQTLNIFTLPLSHFPKSSVLLLDPPWMNKSVSRSHEYKTVTLSELTSSLIRIVTACLQKDTVVGVWITNDPSVLKFTTEILFKVCQIKYTGRWTWYKIAQDGNPVMPLHSTHRRPYEQLIWGTFHDETTHECNDIVVDKIMVSVPLRHSWKPNIDGLLPKKYQNKDIIKTELFARELKTGWHSMGNQVLEFQKSHYWTGL